MKKISVICIDCESNYIDEVLLGQTYRNLEVVEAVTGKDFYEDIAMYCAETDSDYICFLEPGQRLEADKIIKMTEYAEKFPEAAAILCCRNYIEGDGLQIRFLTAGNFYAHAQRSAIICLGI